MNRQKPRPGRPRKAEEALRREQLLEHAVRLFGEQGFGTLSLETIAREARVSLRTIYCQFGGKAGLFSAAVRRYSDMFVAALPVDGDAGHGAIEEVLVEFAQEYLFRLTRPELIRLRAQLMAEAHRFPDLASEFYHQGPQRTLNHLARFFESHQNSGAIVGLAPLFLAGQLVNALRGERYQRLQLGLETSPSIEDIEPWARQVVGLFLRGCVADVAETRR